jgi:uncharacterized membrane protein
MTARSVGTTSLWVAAWAGAVLLLACEALDAYQRGAPAVVWFFKLAPLLLVLPGALRDRLRSWVWVSFVSLLYFLFAVQRVFAEPAALRGQLELLAVVVLFLASMLYVRWRARELRATPVEEAA